MTFELTENEIAKADDWWTHVVTNKKCESCGEDDWNFSKELGGFNIVRYDGKTTNYEMHPDRGYTVIIVHCLSCGYVRQYYAHIILDK